MKQISIRFLCNVYYIIYYYIIQYLMFYQLYKAFTYIKKYIILVNIISKTKIQNNLQLKISLTHFKIIQSLETFSHIPLKNYISKA